MLGMIFGCTLVVAGVLFTVYLWTIVWTNGCGSKYRKFRIVSYYYKDGWGYDREKHHVQWCFFPNLKWHAYITDAHYMDTAQFYTKEEALKFIKNETNPDLPKVEIEYVNV